jgi:histone acetyltransferase (RNA polymerase elongator complex component)
MHKKHYNIPVFIPNLACPNQCIFCSQKNIAGIEKLPSHEEIQNTVKKYLSTIPENSETEIAFFGGTFTGLPVAEQEKYLQSVQGYIKEGRINGIRISTRPDCINTDNLSLLKTYNVTAIELGAQSMDDEVLKLSRRGHTSNDVIKSSAIIKDAHISLGLQMMIGLPGDTLDKTIYTARKLAGLSPDTARIYPALVINDTELEQMYLEKKYVPLSLKEAVAWSSRVLQIFEDHEINVIRVGLHPSEGLLSGKSFIAGPFHPSFRELVLTEIWRKLLEPFLQLPEKEELILSVRHEEYNYAIGYEGANKKMLAEKFRTVLFKIDPSIKKGRNYGVIYS